MSVDESDMGVAKAVPHGEQCDKALEHYDEISNEASNYSSLVPKAIEFYKERWVPQGERKIVRTPTSMEEALGEGWMFDPWLNPMGRPISVDIKQDHPSYWILVKGTPEQIAEMDPIAVLPEGEEEPEPEKPLGYVAVKTEYIPYDKEGKPSREPPEDFVIMHKDHIYAKGTVYTLLPGATKA